MVSLGFIVFLLKSHPAILLFHRICLPDPKSPSHSPVWVLPILAVLYSVPRYLGGRMSQMFLNLRFHFGTFSVSPNFIFSSRIPGVCVRVGLLTISLAMYCIYYFCVCVLHVCLCVCMYMCMWRPEDKLGFCSLGAFCLIFVLQTVLPIGLE